MISLHLQRLADGNLCLAGMDEHWRHVLVGVPALLAEPQPPAVQERLFPNPSNQAAINRDWRELIAPELEALWRTNYELMAADLGRVEKDPAHRRYWRVAFPANHAAAWLSALNQARLVMASRWDVTEGDMTRPVEELEPTERGRDIVLINQLEDVERLFIEVEEGSNP
ncbi:MAG: DUF2017 family protein [Verrucomicrobia bacterium]|nr:DUF2017 family protein [Verrucomicrobiota bacterium]